MPRWSPPGASRHWQLFVEGDSLYDAMCADIASARKTIRMESYIFADDAIGRQLATALIKQARQGCRVRLRIDYAGSRWELSEALIREMTTASVEFEWAHRWQWRRPWAFHQRNHRKLLIIDDAVVYLGGFNVIASSSRRCVGEARWRDTHVRVRGPLAKDAIGHFSMGSYELDAQPSPTGLFKLLPSSTRHCRRRLRCEIDQALRRAQHHIWVTTPYFIPDHGLRRRLVRAARRGVDVRVLTPSRSDVPITQWAARAHYQHLLRAGVQVFEYVPRVLHAKTLVVDYCWATVGTANLDYRSMFTNLEINLVATDIDFCAALAVHFKSDLESARRIDYFTWQQRSWWQLAREALVWPLRQWL